MCAFDTQRRALTYGVCCVHAYVDRSQLGSLKIANEISNNPTLHVRSFDTHQSECHMVQISIDPVNSEGTSTYKP